MATLEEIRIDIKGNMDDINKKLNKLEKQINQTTSVSANRFKAMANVVKATVGAVVVQQIASAGIKLAQFSGDIDELKSKSSAVFKEFTSDVRGELQTFGDAVGRSTAELEGMAAGVQDTFVPLGFARGEAAKLSTNLTKLAVDVASFNNASDTETMNLFKSALVGNHEAVRRFGIVITESELKAELFRMGITKNANEVDAQTKVQARLNLIMAGTADAQGDATRTAGSFANRQRALRAELSEVGDELGLTLQPALASTVNFLIEATKSAREFLTVLGILTPRIDSLASANERIGELEAQITKMGGKTGFFGFGGLKLGPIDTTGIMTPGLKKEIERLQTELNVVRILRRNMIAQKSKIKIENEATKTTERLAQASRTFADVLGDVQKENAKVVALISARSDRERELIELRASSIKDDMEMTKEQRAELELLLKTLQANETILNNRNNELDRAKGLVEASITPLQKYKEDIMALDFALGEGEITQEQYTRTLANVKKEYKELNDVIPEMSALNQIFLDTTVQVANGLENAFISALDGSKSALESMRDISRQLIEEILRKYMRLTIINPIIKGIFGPVTGFDSTAFPSATTGEIFSGFRKTFLGAKAGGGTVQGRKPVMVGERGPEMFVPNTGGRIVPNGALGGSLRGGSPTIVNQSLNFATGIQNTVRAEVMNLMPVIQNATLQAVVDQKRRGGSFGQGMS